MRYFFQWPSLAVRPVKYHGKKITKVNTSIFRKVKHPCLFQELDSLFTFLKKKFTMIPAGYHGNFLFIYFFKKNFLVDPQLMQIRCPSIYIVWRILHDIKIS